MDAIKKITGSVAAADTLRPGDMFYNLGEKFYYDTAAISADPVIRWRRCGTGTPNAG